MKIGILTYHTVFNYGALLQAWALLQMTRQLGHKGEIVRFEPQPMPLWSLKRWFARSFSVCLLKWRHEWYSQKKKRQFRSFQSRLILGSTCYHSMGEISRNPPAYDVYLAGSDQIWWCTPLKSTVYFLDFGPESVKRVAYASSFGTDSIPPEFVSVIRRCLLRFHRVSVREESGVRILRDLGVSGVLVPDPCLLYGVEAYRTIINESFVPCENCGIFIYLLHNDPISEQAECEEYLRKTGMFVYNVDLHKNHVFTFDARLPTVEQWLFKLSSSSFVLTNSFHAVVFSLLFHKNFIVRLRHSDGSKMNNRIMTLLDAVGLPHLAVDTLSPESLDFAMKVTIDWQRVDERVNDFRLRGLEFLKEALQ